MQDFSCRALQSAEPTPLGRGASQTQTRSESGSFRRKRALSGQLEQKDFNIAFHTPSFYNANQLSKRRMEIPLSRRDITRIARCFASKGRGVASRKSKSTPSGLLLLTIRDHPYYYPSNCSQAAQILGRHFLTAETQRGRAGKASECARPRVSSAATLCALYLCG